MGKGHVCTLAMLAWGLAATVAFAQRGVGDPEGVARQAVRPEVVSLAGKVVKVETGPCQMTTGRSPLGTHFLLQTAEGKTLNIHLGPAAAVEFVAKDLSRDKPVKVEAFRTEQMKEGHYVACKLMYGEQTVTLRDETLQPVWAMGRGQGGGRGWYGGGLGRGPNAASGPGWGRGYGRRGAGPGRGYGGGPRMAPIVP